MCSVLGLPDIGSNITLHITRVNLNPHSVLVEFGGYLNHRPETREVHRQIKEEIDFEKESQDNFEGIPGDVCYVYDDKDWHRARILSKYEHEYNVFLIDEGKLFWTSRNVLAKCPPNLFSLPPTVELCILAGALPLCFESGWSEAASEFIRCLCGKNISGRVQDVMMPYRILLLDIPSVSDQMYELGFTRKASNEDFKSLVKTLLHSPKGNISIRTDFAMPNVQEHTVESEMLYQYLYPELLPGTIEIVTVTHVVHPLKIFCKLHVFSQELKKLSDVLHKCHEDAIPSLISQPLSDGSPCATKGSDGKWYRSVLQQNTVSDFVKVFHVDYGIGDFVKLCNIRPLSARFLQLPVVTYACSLHGIVDKGTGWRTDQIDFLKSIVQDQIFIGKFEEPSLHEGVYHVTLYGSDNVNVNNVFGLKEHCLSVAERQCADKTLEALNKVTYRHQHDNVPACFPSPNTSSSTDTREDISAGSRTEANLEPTERMQSLNNACDVPPKTEVGTKKKVWITCVRSVNQFYGHFVHNFDTIKKMTRDIQQLCCKRTQGKFSLSPKMMCFAKYTDGLWHRGQIESTHPKLLVHFVDYGNVLALDRSEILPLTPEASAVASIPIHTVEFELFNVTLPESHDLNEWFENYATDGVFCVTVMKQNPLGKLSVEMYDEKTNLNLKMKEKWSKTKKLKQGSNINREADKARACKVFSEVIESKRQREQFSTTTQANEMMYRKVSKPVVQGTLEQNCNTIGHSEAGCNDSRQQLATQQKVLSHYPKLTDLPSRSLNEGYVSEVYLSHCNSPSSFYVQLTSEEDKTFSLLDELNSSQLSSAQVDLQALRPGDVVQAEYPSDGAWYRAVVQNKQDSKVQVQFIDFGNEATLPPLKIRQLDKRFLNMPRLSIHCSLEDGKTGYKRDWTKEQVIAFKKAAGENGEKKILCKFIRNNRSAWLVSLEHRGIVLEGPSFNMTQTDSQMPGTKDIQPVMYKEPAVTERQAVEAYASSICGPNYFWCQFKNSEELDKISLIAQEIGNGTQTKPIQQDQLHEGLPCLARFSDELWYRAQIITKLPNRLSVLFIDYGNESEIDLNSVKSLSRELLERPPQAFLCQLGGFGSTQDTWNDVASDKFFELLVDEPLKVTIQNTVMNPGHKCPQYNVLVECKGLVVNDFMKDYWCGPKPQICSQVSEGTKLNPLEGQNKQAVASPKTVQKDLIHDSVNTKLLVQDLPQATDLPSRVIETGMVCEVYISHIVSLSSFFVQLAENEDILFSLSEQLNSPQLSEKHVIHASSVQQGSLVKAVFPEDECWYRAVVKETTENGMVQVEFIDFGNEAIVSPSNICRLDELLLSYPRFSIHCSSSFEDQLKMQKGLEEEILFFKNVFGQVGENRLSCKFIKEDEATWEVKMALKGSTLGKSEKLDDTNQNQQKFNSAKHVVSQAEVSIPVNPQFKKPDVSLGQMVEAFASCIVGPNYFWCQFANSEQLDQISHFAQEYGNSNETQSIQIDHLGPGSPCLARFSDDLMWYRAQVIKKSNDMISVLFVDYGNESEIDESSLKALTCNLLDAPPQAFLCLLEGFAPSEGSWDDTAADHFHELLMDKPLKVTVNAIENTVDPNSPPYCVKIETEQCLVNELMRNFWSASVRRDQNSDEVFISCENSVESGELCVSEDNQTSETQCVPLPESGEVEELEEAIAGLDGTPESKVDDKLDKTDMTATLTNYNAMDNSPTRTYSLLENDDQIHESDDRVPVVSGQETLLDTEDSRKETEDERSDKDALATSNKSRTWTAGLETLPMVCNEEFCESTTCISK
ncbi:tudor domain-containing 6 [Paramisgurnus dabryanus]|uniref:tudor domain-containing 6 n=1 Tax=Paramisgurnus dabryanus TaxID=90735 RepID=UPI0031F38106